MAQGWAARSGLNRSLTANVPEGVEATCGDIGLEVWPLLPPASLRLTTAAPWQLRAIQSTRVSLLASFSKRFLFFLIVFSNEGENGYDSKMGDGKPSESP